MNEIDINLDFEDIINYPAISVVTDAVAVRNIVRGEATIEFKPTIVLYQIFKSQKPQQRRHGVYPIVVASIRLLTGQMLGLEIEPLVPVSTSEIFHEKLKALGAVGFQTRFTTSFEVESIDDQDVIQLLSEGLSYFNEPGGQPIANDIFSHYYDEE